MQGAGGKRAQIRIDVYFYSIVADLVGKREEQWTVPSGTNTVRITNDLAYVNNKRVMW